MRVGTKSVLFGAHCFLIHPFFIAAGWLGTRGFPWDFRLWVAFFVHDLGYIGCPNVEGPGGGGAPPTWGQDHGIAFRQFVGRFHASPFAVLGEETRRGRV